MRALLLDGINESASQALGEAGLKVTVAEAMSLDQLLAEIDQYHLLAVRSKTKVTAAVLEAGTNLLAVGRGGAGIDSVDYQRAAELGIVVFATPGANAPDVAECVAGQILSSLHRLQKGAFGLRDCQWLKRECGGQSLRGKTVGIYGFGYVGKWVVRLLEHVPGISFLSFDTNPAAGLPWVPLVRKEELLARSDVVSLHPPLNEGTWGMVNEEFLRLMKSGATLVNFSSGALLADKGRWVIQALLSGQLGCYIADVFDSEPPEFQIDPLFGSDALIEAGKLVLTPHLAASSVQAQADVADMLVQQATRLFCQGEMPWGANYPGFYLERSGQSRLIVFHPDVVGTIKGILRVLEDQGINVAGNINQRVKKDGPAYTVIDVDGGIQPAVVEQIRTVPDVQRIHVV